MELYTFKKLSGASRVIKAQTGKNNIFHHGLGRVPTVPILVPHSDARVWVTLLDKNSMRFSVSADCLVTCTVVE